MNNSQLVTEHLILRKAVPSDLELIWNRVWKQEELSKMMLWEPTPTLEEAKDRLERTIQYQKDHYAYFVCLKEINEPIGFAGIQALPNHEYEETGICIAKEFQGKGYAKEVVSALRKLIFEELNGNRFYYGCFHENERSRRVCLALGFRYYHSQVNVREWDQYEHVSDYYYFDRGMYEDIRGK